MNVLRIICVCASLSAATHAKDKNRSLSYQLEPGDILFQQTSSSQGAAVQHATKSPWSHVGIYWMDEKGNELVFEAVHPVRLTPLKQFRARSKGVIHAMRLKDRDRLSRAQKRAMFNYAAQQLGKPYDVKFRWDEATQYCSELVWKVFQNGAGIRLCEPKNYGDYDLDHPKVAELINRRYGAKQNLPAKEKVVAPSDLAGSALLIEVPRETKPSKPAQSVHPSQQ